MPQVVRIKKYKSGIHEFYVGRDRAFEATDPLEIAKIIELLKMLNIIFSIEEQEQCPDISDI